MTLREVQSNYEKDVAYWLFSTFKSSDLLTYMWQNYKHLVLMFTCMHSILDVYIILIRGTEVIYISYIWYPWLFFANSVSFVWPLLYDKNASDSDL